MSRVTHHNFDCPLPHPAPVIEREGFSEENGTLPGLISESTLWEFDISESTTSKAAAKCNMADVEGLFPGRQTTERRMADPR